MNSSQRVATEIEGEVPPPDKYKPETYKSQLKKRKDTKQQMNSTFPVRKLNTQDEGRQELWLKHANKIQELRQVIKEGRGDDSAPHDYDHDINRLIRGFQLDDDRNTVTISRST